jgi:hypothetical protein
MATVRTTLAVFVVLWSCGVVQATSVTHAVSQGPLAASATFDVSSSSLVVTLTNTSTCDCRVPSDLLSAVLFDLAGDPVLTPASAVLGADSHVCFGTDLYANDPGPGGSVGAHWAYTDDISAGSAPVLARYGISSAGLDVFGKHDVFPGGLVGGENTPPDGMPYGMLSAGHDLGQGNGGMLAIPLIKDSVVFTLDGLPGGFNPSQAVTNVFFQYGTSWTPIPEPVTMAGMLMGVGSLFAYVRRRSR